MSDRYYLKADHQTEWDEVSKEQFIAAEQAAGFRSKFGPTHPATNGFSGGGMRGRVEYTVKEATKEQPMSDTLQEREDQKTPDWHNFVPQDDYNVRLCAICGFGKNDHYRFYPQCDQNATATDYCNECKGRPHAPWCSLYRAADEISDGEYRQSANQHQPAARGGGDEWCLSTDGLTVLRKPEGEVGYLPLMRSSYGKWQDDDPHWPTKNQAAAIMREVVQQHNQHQSLVAEREALRRMLANVIDTNYGTSYHHIGDGDGMPAEQAKEIADWWKAELERIQREYDQQRSTSE